MKRLSIILICILAGIVFFYTLPAQNIEVSEPPSMEDVTVKIATPGLTLTPVVCDSLPEGMNLSVTALSSTEVLVQISGLQEEEWITLIYERDLVSDQRLKGRTEFHPSQPIKEDGFFEDFVGGLTSLPGVSPNRWQVQVVHSRGVACQIITLPDNK
jgi:hypothetical protein